MKNKQIKTHPDKWSFLPRSFSVEHFPIPTKKLMEVDGKQPPSDPSHCSGHPQPALCRERRGVGVSDEGELQSPPGPTWGLAPCGITHSSTTVLPARPPCARSVFKRKLLNY